MKDIHIPDVRAFRIERDLVGSHVCVASAIPTNPGEPGFDANRLDRLRRRLERRFDLAKYVDIRIEYLAA